MRGEKMGQVVLVTLQSFEVTLCLILVVDGWNNLIKMNPVRMTYSILY